MNWPRPRLSRAAETLASLERTVRSTDFVIGLQCREHLSQLRDLTYLCDDSEVLTNLKKELATLVTRTKAVLKTEDGLIVQPHVTLKTKTNHKNYASLPLRTKEKNEKPPVDGNAGNDVTKIICGVLGEKRAGTERSIYDKAPPAKKMSFSSQPTFQATAPTPPNTAASQPHIGSSTTAPPNSSTATPPNTSSTTTPPNTSSTTTPPNTSSTATTPDTISPIVIDDDVTDPLYWINFKGTGSDETVIVLYEESSHNILDSGYELRDSEIHAGLQLLKRQFPFIGGLNDPAVCNNLVTPETHEFVQVINSGGHWVCRPPLAVPMDMSMFLTVLVADQIGKSESILQGCCFAKARISL